MPNGLLDPRGEMRATPRNKLLGLLADALSAANDYAQAPDPRMPGGKANPVLGLLADAAGLQSAATTAGRVAYGEPLTNGLRGSKAFLKPETADVAMMAPISPRNALAALGMVGGVADNGAMRAATVWHGSPHKFDKFDASKIGTGEGAQAYGHGLYLAEAKDVAKGYADVLGQGWTVDGALVDGPLEHAAQIVKQYGTDGARSYVQGLAASKDFSGRPKVSPEWVSEQLKAIDGLAGKRVEYESTGSLYKVDLPDEAIAKMLDYDKPLSQQSPAVQAAVDNIKRTLTGPFSQDMTGDQFLRHVQATLKGVGRGDVKAESLLRQSGIPGIRYLDGGSRSAGAGSSNFVVFDDSLPTILERNGQALR